MNRSIALFLCCLVAVTFAACSSSSESSGPSAPVGLIVPNVDFGTIQPGMYDTTVSITNAGSDYLTITSNGTSGEARDTNFMKPIVLTPHGYEIMHVQFMASDSGSRTAYDSIRYQGGVALMKMSAKVTTSAPPRTGGGSALPGKGSTFTYSYTSIDTNGNQIGPFDSTYTVLQNSTSYQGKTNVLVVGDENGGVSYYHMESNGDISVYMDLSASSQGGGPNIKSGWMTIPIASRIAINTPLFDSSMSLDLGLGVPVTVQISVSAQAQYVSSPSISAAGQTFATDAGSLAIVFNVTGLGGLFSSSQTSTTTVYYSKALGFYPKRQDVSSTTSSQLTGGGTPTTTSDTYTLKAFVKK